MLQNPVSGALLVQLLHSLERMTAWRGAGEWGNMMYGTGGLHVKQHGGGGVSRGEGISKRLVPAFHTYRGWEIWLGVPIAQPSILEKGLLNIAVVSRVGWHLINTSGDWSVVCPTHVISLPLACFWRYHFCVSPKGQHGQPEPDSQPQPANWDLPLLG